MSKRSDPASRWPRVLPACCVALCVATVAVTAESTRAIAEAEGDPTPMSKEPRIRQDDLRDRLTPLQYHVTQEDGTEPAFNNAYWDNTREGIYVDVVSGKPLFSSTTKFKSGTGWPSFTAPIDPQTLATKTDKKFFITRTEVRGTDSDAHLGHLFDDGPAPTGLRYCMNSAALRFIAKNAMASEGYANLLHLFDPNSSP